MFVMGIDPGLSRCGYGVVARVPGHGRAGMRAEAAGVITTPVDDPLPTRLAALATELEALFAAKRGAEVVQYSPNEVKMAVTGYGAASKAQVQRMVQALLGLAEPPRPPDAADALALAVTHLGRAALARAAAVAIAASGRP
jgi:crossover junction endodeoxyribonuclease RuvC